MSNHQAQLTSAPAIRRRARHMAGAEIALHHEPTTVIEAHGFDLYPRDLGQEIAPERRRWVRGGLQPLPLLPLQPSGGEGISSVEPGIDLIADYGHVVVDECHHLSAVSFEAIAREAKAKFALGLSATVTRKDGHHPIIFMQCGLVRHRVDARQQAAAHPFLHKAVFRRTGFRRDGTDGNDRPAIQHLYGLLAPDEARNTMIFNDILSVLEAGRSPVVITERKDHLQILADRLSKFAKNVIVLKGGMGVRKRRRVAEALESIPDDEERVLVATGRYLGEGFDDARLDTLFLTMPISWRGTLAQYAGRLHRLHTAKREVVVYDYVDDGEPMLVRMAAKREVGYRSLGYNVTETMDSIFSLGARRLPGIS